MSNDPSEIILICWFAAQETFLIIINVENSCAVIFMWKPWYNSFRILWIENSKEQSLFEIEIICNNINVFTVTFDQFNASLLNKSNNIFKKQHLTDPKLLYDAYISSFIKGLEKNPLYIYIYRERERERETETDRESTLKGFCLY